MARPSNPEIRSRLLDRAIDFVLAHGVQDLSLRPLAAALQTNARMLIYHFNSREELLRAILNGIRDREARRIEDWFATGTAPKGITDFVRWYWRVMSAPEARPTIRLVFDLYALALRNPDSYPDILNNPLEYWRKLMDMAGIATEAGNVQATLFLAVIRGLQLDLVATDDQDRVQQALDLLLDLLDRHDSQNSTR